MIRIQSQINLYSASCAGYIGQAEEAIRVARLGREMAKLLGQEDNNFVKLEVIPDPKYLLPDPIGTLQAAEQLVKEGFAVLPYINADPLLCKRLEDAGCATVMPLGSPIGSGQGIQNLANIKIIMKIFLYKKLQPSENSGYFFRKHTIQ